MAEQVGGAIGDTGPGAASRRSTGRAVSIERSFCHLERSDTRFPSLRQRITHPEGAACAVHGMRRSTTPIPASVERWDPYTAVRGVRMARA